MAFYNRKIAKNKTLIKAWKAGHRRKLDEGEEICMPEICDEIARWMRRDRRPRSRLSLRSFSTLLSGTIRLYRDQVDDLLKDTLNCSLLKKPAIPKPSLGTENQETSTYGETLSHSDGDQSKLTENASNSSISTLENSVDEDMSEESTVFTVTPNNQQASAREVHEKKGVNRDIMIPASPSPESDIGIGETLSHSDEDQSKLTENPLNSSISTLENSVDEDMSEESTVFTVTPNNQQANARKVQDKKGVTKDKMIQTAPTPESDIGIGNTTVFDPNLPFAYIVVHENFHSRIPSKILLSSLNENVNFYPFANQ